MSRKTVVFRMPTLVALPRDATPPGAAEALQKDVLRGAFVGDIPGDENAAPSEPDRWVQNRDGEPLVEIALSAARPDLAAPALGAIAFDLAAERNLSQVVALSLAIPSMLGWFWLANIFGGYRREFAK